MPLQWHNHLPFYGRVWGQVLEIEARGAAHQFSECGTNWSQKRLWFKKRPVLWDYQVNATNNPATLSITPTHLHVLWDYQVNATKKPATRSITPTHLPVLWDYQVNATKKPTTWASPQHICLCYETIRLMPQRNQPPGASPQHICLCYETIRLMPQRNQPPGASPRHISVWGWRSWSYLRSAFSWCPESWRLCRGIHHHWKTRWDNTERREKEKSSYMCECAQQVWYMPSTVVLKVSLCSLIKGLTPQNLHVVFCPNK